MTNVNDLNKVGANQNKSSGMGKFTQILALCAVLNIANPAEIKATNTTNENLQSVEIVQKSDIISNIQRRTGVSLPSMYTQKFNNFVSNSKILKDKDAIKFTEDFIVKQMQSNRGISKQNQLLFIWDAVYEQITSKNIYTGEDGNSARLSEFEDVMNKVEQCGKSYNSGFKAYMRQQSADARQQSADARQESIRALNKSLQSMKEFYYLYKQSPNLVTRDEINRAKNDAKITINDCKRYGIDYKTKLSPDVRRFYGIE